MNPVGNIKTIAKRELFAYFSSPVAYVFIVIFLLLNGFFTFMVGGFFERGEASLANVFFMCPLRRLAEPALLGGPARRAGPAGLCPDGRSSARGSAARWPADPDGIRALR